MITIGRIRLDGVTLQEFSQNYDKVYIIVRSIGNEQRKNAILCAPNIVHLPVLSPSWALFQEFRSEVDKNFGQFPTEWFNRIYVPQFLHELAQPAAKAALHAVYEEAKSKNIIMLCFCKDEWNCHRSIVLGLMQGFDKRFGNHVTSCRNDYSRYYELTNQQA